MDNTEYLIHYGVLGMKWGVRRNRSTINNGSSFKTQRIEKKTARIKATNEGVKNYRKLYDDWSGKQEKAEKLKAQMNKDRMALGKTKIGRTVAAIRNNTPEAKKYSKSFDEYSKAADLADDKWREVHDAHIKTGRNKVERIINNMKYDMRKNQKKNNF